MAADSDTEPLEGRVRLVTSQNVFVTLPDGNEVRVSRESFPVRPHVGKRVSVWKRPGKPQDFAGGPNADLNSTLL